MYIIFDFPRNQLIFPINSFFLILVQGCDLHSNSFSQFWTNFLGSSDSNFRDFRFTEVDCFTLTIELAQLIPLPYYWGRSMSTVPFPHTARHRNTLSIKCFPWNYDLNGFNSKINRHLLTAEFLYFLIILGFFFL